MNRESEALTWMLTVAREWESDECLLFPFYVEAYGYGRLQVGAVRVLAHRFICEATHGPAPVGKQAAHSCGIQLCVNKRHVRWATPVENSADKKKHGTTARGSSHGRAKLTEAEVLAIRAAKGTQCTIASQYGVAQQTVSRIKRGEKWAWL